MIQVGDTGLYFDGGHKGDFTIYLKPGTIFTDPYGYGNAIHQILGTNVDCSGEIFKIILDFGNFNNEINPERFLKNHEWIIKECIEKQIEGHKHWGKCYICGVNSSPKITDQEVCYPEGIKPEWREIWLGSMKVDLTPTKFIDMSNAPVVYLKDFDLRSEYIYGLHMICRIKSIKNPEVNGIGSYQHRYTQDCVFCDDDTSKIIKGVLTDSVADYDKWHTRDKVEVWGVWKFNKFHVTAMELIEEDNLKPLPINRNVETPGYDEWRQSIITRDNVCQCCGYDKYLEAHHMFGYAENPELATNEYNGVTLCKFCHDKYHSVYGKKNINPVDFMNFIKRFGVR